MIGLLRLHASELLKASRQKFPIQPRDIPKAVARFDLVKHLYRQRAFSERTWGPGPNTAGVCDHIRRELAEIEAAPSDILEWVDVMLLSLDGAWRAGYSPEQICAAIARKQAINESRRWPDWRTQPRDRAIEHDHSSD